MAILDEGRCGRCGADPFLAGTPYTIWVWFAREHGNEAMPLHLCVPAGASSPPRRSAASI